MRQPRVAVIGAGFGGIAVAALLRQAGFGHVALLERSGQVGGVWRENTYPGCACDIPAPLYSYSFAPYPHWTRRFPSHAEILEYLEGCVDRFGLRPSLRLRTEVTRAQWDDTRAVWVLTTSSGERVEAELLVPAMGQLTRPVVPRLPGIETFAGPAFHTAQWDHDVDLRGRRVAVVGTGASAVQVVPAIAQQARHVTVFQRSAPWTLPKPARRYTRLGGVLNTRVPVLMRPPRLLFWGLTVLTGLAVTGVPWADRVVRGLSTAQRTRQVRDPALRAAVTPDYPMGCKRVLFTSDWYPTLQRADVTLVTTGVRGVTPTALVDADGTEHPCDVIVFGTGFAATKLLAPLEVVGRGGAVLHDAWRDGAHAYLGLTVPDFPNLFMLYGPNTNTGNTSVVYFLEAQARYVVQAARVLARHGGGALEVRRDVEVAYDEEMQRRLAGSVWTACTNWYRDGGGRVVTNWPGLASEYRRRTARFDEGDFVRTQA